MNQLPNLDQLIYCNFPNAQTYHYVQWLLHSKMVDVDALVNQAIDNVSNMGQDILPEALDELTGILSDMLEKMLADWCRTYYAEVNPEKDILAYGQPDDYVGEETLFEPLFANCVLRIDNGAAALALLRCSKIWPRRPRHTFGD